MIELEKKPIRVLHLVRKMDMGGVQMMLMNYYRGLDKKVVQFDFIVQDFEEGYYDSEILQNGGFIFKVRPIKNPIGFYKDVNKILRNNEYSIIHIHENFRNVHALLLSYINRIPNRISHSHNAYPEPSNLKKIIKANIKYLINILSTEKFACSYHAANWLYGKKTSERGDVTILKNAINVDSFSFDSEIRDVVRSKLNLSDKIVIGHIGSFTEQKNHSFIIKIFKELAIKNPNYHLLLIGEGPNQNKIKREVNTMDLSGKVSFLGKKSDTNDLLQAFDLFLFPSLYEGLGMVLLEAQTSGLPIITSDEVPKEIVVTPLVTFQSLNKTPATWAESIEKKLNIFDRKNMKDKIIAHDYDIESQCVKIQNLYLEMYNKSRKDLI
ncbi:glycosyltransferase family 1 protein [Salinicoccus roseus]|uniref:glycosyltransferase family 1 protein n=1 Tax=Salinicoccus roseus TaxID=45670 RepID=UPI001CA6B1C5|nr:glycosyltransferase family 1 protein [Salinicoccus roseus]MBY8908368.1 glycosyltransferase family 1 protein [Salinicoccus roseus]